MKNVGFLPKLLLAGLIRLSKNTTMTTTQTLEQTIRDLEKAETVAFLNEDFDGLNAIWHPDFSVNTPLNRILNAAETQGAMRAGFIRYSFLERVIEQVMIHSGVVVTLGHEVAIPIDNAPMAGQKITRRCTNIWVSEGNTWRMFSRHASNITE